LLDDLKQAFAFVRHSQDEQAQANKQPLINETCTEIAN
jgi:cystathionine gamma-synthase